MSIDTIGARIAEISQLTTALQNGTAAATAPATSFSSALASATATAAPTAAAAPTALAAGGDSTTYDGLIQQAATRYGIDPALLKGLIKQESGFNPAARSAAGASGLTQLMPGTAAGLGVTDPTDPAQAIDGGAKYLRQQLDRFGGDPRKALAAYNAGPGAVMKYGGVPPYEETQNYVRVVMANAERYRTGSASASTAAPLPTPVQALSAPATTTTTPLSTSTSLPYSTT